jgi:hypothetical protein
MQLGSSLGLLPSCFWMLPMKIANNSLGEWAEQWQRWLVAGLPKTSQSENKSDDTVERENRRDLAMATPRKGFHFYNSTESNGHPNRLR